MSPVSRQSDVTIIELPPGFDSLDDRALQDFGDALLNEANHADPPWLVVDLSPTDYIASSFLELLVRAWKRIKQRDGVMALSGVHPFCLEVLQVTRLSTLWPIHATSDEAAAALAGSANRGDEAAEDRAIG